ncbi:hypothetical protein BG004_004233 [Podila humilis]|nr:hypothetical protein BG004_004233 [Podila humilis]
MCRRQKKYQSYSPQSSMTETALIVTINLFKRGEQCYAGFKFKNEWDFPLRVNFQFQNGRNMHGDFHSLEEVELSPHGMANADTLLTEAGYMIFASSNCHSLAQIWVDSGYGFEDLNIGKDDRINLGITECPDYCIENETMFKKWMIAFDNHFGEA